MTIQSVAETLWSNILTVVLPPDSNQMITPGGLGERLRKREGQS